MSCISNKSNQYYRTETEEKDTVNKDDTRNMSHTGQLNKQTNTYGMDTIR